MFLLTKIENGKASTPEMCRMPVTAGETYTMGEALVISASGTLTKAPANALPTYIAAENHTAPAAGARGLYCYRISADMEFAVPVSVSPADIVIGTSVTLGTDAKSVTATTGGHATVLSLRDAKAAGDDVLVRFIG